MRLLQRLQKMSASPRAVPAVIVLALVLCLPAVGSGLFADDHMHRLMALGDGSVVESMPSRPLDLFVFSDGTASQRRLAQEEGVFGWWTADGFKLAFFRPLSSLTHTVDLLLWPDSPWLMHLHNLAWFLALLLVVHRLFRRWVPTPWVATLALALYALDDARALPVAWVAHRNALISVTLGVGALLAHDRWRRDGWRPGAALGPALFALALLGGESAVATGAWLFAFSLTLDPARGARRLAPLVPYVVLGVAWLAVRHALGYGTHASGVYTDPLDDPLGFLLRVAEYMPVLLQSQLGAIPADIWIGVPVALRFAVAIPLYLLFLAWLGVVAWPLKDRPEVRLFVLGMLLAAVPVCATFPAERIQIFLGIGGAGLIASMIAAAVERPPARRHARVLVTALAVVHAVVGPLSLPSDARAVTVLRTVIERADAGLPSDAGITDDTFIVVRAPLEPLTGYATLARAAEGRPLPAWWNTLAITPGAVTVTRPDERTLRIAPELGFLSLEIEQMTRDGDLPMPVGTRVVLEKVTVEVVETTPEGRPTAIEARFGQALPAPGLRFFHWEGLTYVPFELPAVGETVELPAVDPLALLFGLE